MTKGAIGAIMFTKRNDVTVCSIKEEKQMSEPRKLKRSISDKKIFGVCGGIGEYANIDSTFIRLLFILAVIAGTVGLWIYLILALIMPKSSDVFVGDEGIKRLRRPRKGSKLFGVCDAFANYFDVDVTVLRVIMAILGIFGIGILAYIASALVIPVEESE